MRMRSGREQCALSCLKHLCILLFVFFCLLKGYYCRARKGADTPRWMYDENELLIHAVASILNKSERWLISATLKGSKRPSGKTEGEALHNVST